MSVVCGICGNPNRDNAMFCSGCAGRLPGFAPTGPSALETMGTRRPPHAPSPDARARPTGSSVTLLPAETPAFWLRLGLLTLAMGIGFIAWYLYVTREITAPSLPTPVAAALALEDTTSEPASNPTPTSAPAPAVPAPVQIKAEKSAAAAPAARAQSMPPVKRRARAPAWTGDDPGPPIAIGPGPLHEPVRAPAWTRDDPGPPIAAGPGPLYEPVRAPAWTRDDPGPPIVIGPGPLYDSARTPRSR